MPVVLYRDDETMGEYVKRLGGLPINFPYRDDELVPCFLQRMSAVDITYSDDETMGEYMERIRSYYPNITTKAPYEDDELVEDYCTRTMPIIPPTESVFIIGKLAVCRVDDEFDKDCRHNPCMAFRGNLMLCEGFAANCLF